MADYKGQHKGVEIDEAIAKAKTALQEHQDISHLATRNEVEAGLKNKQNIIDDLAAIRSGASSGASAVQPGALASVATSGSYNDLKNKPSIPGAVTEATVAGWGFTKNTGTYSKPSAGIPKTDLATTVQSSLNKAESALQSYTEKYQGTVTGVKINGSTKSPSSGVIDLGTVITAHQDISFKQDKYDIVDMNAGVATLQPHHYYRWMTIMDSISIELMDEDNNRANEFVFEFTCGDGTSLTMPNSIVWANGGMPPLTAGKTYVVSIVNNLAVFAEF